MPVNRKILDNTSNAIFPLRVNFHFFVEEIGVSEELTVNQTVNVLA